MSCPACAHIVRSRECLVCLVCLLYEWRVALVLSIHIACGVMHACGVMRPAKWSAAARWRVVAQLQLSACLILQQVKALGSR